MHCFAVTTAGVISKHYRSVTVNYRPITRWNINVRYRKQIVCQSTV